MKLAELKRKARENESMTVSEIKAYEKLDNVSKGE